MGEESGAPVGEVRLVGGKLTVPFDCPARARLFG